MTITELSYASIVTRGGGKFVGIQKGFESVGLEPLVLFNSPQTGTTLALPVGRLTAESVRRKILVSDHEFAARRKLERPLVA